jgi:hypothetical protein
MVASLPPAKDTVDVSQNCLDQRTVKSIAAGRCLPKELFEAGRHLPGCARCRAAVVAAASGIRGPGETIVLKRSSRKGLTWLKVAASLISVLVAGAAWRYGAALRPSLPPRVEAVRVQTALAPAASREASPSPESPAPARGAPAPEPIVAVIAAGAGEEPASRPRGGSPRLRSARPVTTPRPTAEEPAKPEADYDFGIDAPAPPRIAERILRTTIE